MSQQCNEEGYAGNDILCARDSDRDNFPDVELNCNESTCFKVATLHMYNCMYHFIVTLYLGRLSFYCW